MTRCSHLLWDPIATQLNVTRNFMQHKPVGSYRTIREVCTVDGLSKRADE